MPALILINEGMERMVLPLGKAVLFVGSDPESEILLNSEEISRNHASIVYHDGGYVVRDNGSANGTLVNGVQVSEQTLMHNDQLTFGPFHFLIDLECEETNEPLPEEVATHVDRKGQEYRRSVNIQSVTGTQEGPLHVMMAGSSPIPAEANDPEPAASHADAGDIGQAIAAEVPVAGADAPSGLPYLFGGVMAVVAVVAVGVLVLWATESQKSQQMLANEKKAQEELQVQLKKSEEYLRKIEKDASVATSQLAETREQLRKANVDAARLKEESALNQVVLREVKDKLNKLEGAPATASKAAPASTPVAQTSAGPDLAAMRAAIAAKLDPLKLLPEAEYPPKVKIVEATEIPIELNGQVVGKRKIAQGLSFSVVGVDKNSVVVDMAGEHVKIGKEFTNFQVVLGELNEDRRKENAKMREDREAEIGRLAEAAMVEEKQLSVDREAFLKERVPLVFVPRDVLQTGIIGATVGGTLRGSQAFLTGGDAVKIPVGQTWSGDVFPMGSFQLPDDDTRYQHCTLDIKEYAAFKKSGLQENAAIKEVMEASVKKNQAIVAKINEIMKLIDPVKVDHDIDHIDDLDYHRQNDTLVHINSDRFVRVEGPKVKKAAEIALAFTQETTLTGSARSFFEHAIALAELCTETRLKDFWYWEKQLNSEAERLKASLAVQSQTIK